jgi:hypothetical protein
MFTTIMTVINIAALVCVAIGLFISRYTIVDLETWNTIATFYNEHNDEDEGEAASGCGFFWDYVSDVEEPDEEEEEGK